MPAARFCRGGGHGYSRFPTDDEVHLNDLLIHDVAIGPVEDGLPGRRRVLLEDEFVCLVAAGNPRLRDGRLTLADLNELPQARAVRGGLSAEAVTRYLAEAGVSPVVRTSTTVQGLLSLPFVVSDTGLVRGGPEPARQQLPTRPRPRRRRDPAGLAASVEAVHWHPSRHDDPAVVWLLDVLRKVAATLSP
ncbi:LysR substrate-binding domain-containing protein [Nocardia sp. NPDC051911]|uniref:LysR substrate-binding domain-containing protein n=1 Tax=Nocardia sp. NPDC051911 TaxID=3154648 RepID=UPI00343E2D16